VPLPASPRARSVGGNGHRPGLAVTLLAATGHTALGHLDLHVLGTLLLGSIPGVLFASRAAIRLPPVLARTLIGIMLALVSQRMLFAR
jgi:uncharacterized membrane protein YfcA